MSSPSTAVDEQDAAEPEQVRVAVLVGDRQVDTTVPSKVPLSVVMEDLVPVLKRSGGALDYTLTAGHVWTLKVMGGLPIVRSRCLDEEGIADGDLLVLAELRGSERFSPIVEEVSDTVARSNDARYPEFTPATARTMALVVVALGGWAVAAAGYRGWQSSHHPLIVAAVLTVVGVGYWASAILARSHWSAPSTGYALYLGSLPLVGVATAAMVVTPGSTRHAGAANAVCGCVSVLAAAVLFAWITRSAITVSTAVATMALVGVVAFAVIAYGDVSRRPVGAAVAGIAVLLLINGAKLTIAMSRVRPPALPAPGEEVRADTLEEMFHPDAAGQGDSSDGDVAVAAGRRLERRALMANKYLTGLTAGVVITTVIGCAAMIEPHTFHAPVAVALAVIVTIVLGLRARSYVDRAQAVMLYGAALLIASATAAIVMSSYRGVVIELVTTVALAAAVCVGALAGVRGPGSSMSPVSKRMIEIGEYILIVSIAPLVLWTMGVYGAVRGA